MSRTALTAALVAAFALTACSSEDSGGLDDGTRWACSDFAQGYKAAQTKQARIDLADKVTEWAATSEVPQVTEAAVVLARGADGNADTWQLAADAFAIACTDAGWSAETA